MKNQSKAVAKPQQPATPVLPADPMLAAKSRVTGAVLDFVKQNPWKAAAMVAAAGLVFVLTGGVKARA